MNEFNDAQKYMAMTIDDLFDEIQSLKRQLLALQKLYEVRQQFGERTIKQIKAAERKKKSSKVKETKIASPTGEYSQPIKMKDMTSEMVVRGGAFGGGYPPGEHGGVSEA